MDRSIPMLLIGLVFGGGVGFAVAAGNGITLDGHDHGDAGQHGHGPSLAHVAAKTGLSEEMLAGNICTVEAPHGVGAAAAPHDHATPYILPADEDAPSVSLDMRPDPSSGWNLHVETAGFRFAPEHASGAHVPGEGHAHVYVNGEKIGRVYGPWLHLGSLPEGDVTVEVTLNANDHRPFVVGDRPLSASVTVRN